jgi:predicted transcriptional regulator
MTALFLSLRPVFAQLILSGQKTVEVRRVVPRSVQRGSMVLLYESTPVKAWTGICFFDGISIGRPETIWRKLGGATGLAKREFIAYLDGREKAVALHVSRPVTFARPVPLAEIRDTWEAFHPPQSFLYLPVPDVTELAKQLGQTELTDISIDWRRATAS